MKLETLLTKARARYGSHPPSVHRIISEMRCGYQAACRITESLSPVKPHAAARLRQMELKPL